MGKLKIYYNDSAMCREDCGSVVESFDIKENEILSTFIETALLSDIVYDFYDKEIENVTPEQAAEVFDFKLDESLSGIDLILDTMVKIVGTMDPSGDRNVYRCIYNNQTVFDNGYEYDFVDPDEDGYVIVAFEDGKFYGFFSKHPDDEDLPYWSDDINDAICYDKFEEADGNIIKALDGSDLTALAMTYNEATEFCEEY